MGDHESPSNETLAVYFDALQRAVRTWWAAVSGVVAVSVGTALVELLQGSDVLTWDFWVSVIRMTLVALIAATASYWARFKKPPVEQ
jgi:membrane-associated PAP2 superfamily phosphatase